MKRLSSILIRTVTCAAAISVTLSACSNVNPHFDPSKSHHRPDGFANNYPPNPAYKRPEVGFFEGWISRIRNWTVEEETAPPKHPIDPVKPDLAYLHRTNTTPSLTWIGHATFLLQTGSGLNILTDPLFDDRASPVSFAGPKRYQPPGVALKDLPHIDAVLISHGHYDHLSVDSLRALYRQAGGPPKFFAPLGIDLWLARHVTNGDTVPIVKLDWWDKATIGDTTVNFLPVQHWSARTPFDRNRMLWGAFALQRDGFSFFFSGDLGYSKDIADIAARFDGFDLAAIGIGAYMPEWYRNSHITPEQGVQIHRELKIRKSVAMHILTLPMGKEPIDQPVEDLAAARKQQNVPDSDFIVMRHGQTITVDQ